MVSFNSDYNSDQKPINVAPDLIGSDLNFKESVKFEICRAMKMKLISEAVMSGPDHDTIEVAAATSATIAVACMLLHVLYDLREDLYDDVRKDIHSVIKSTMKKWREENAKRHQSPQGQTSSPSPQGEGPSPETGGSPST